MKKKGKAVVVPLERKARDRELEDIQRTPEERIRVMFDLMRLSVLFSPPGGFKDTSNTSRKWWVLNRTQKNV